MDSLYLYGCENLSVLLFYLFIYLVAFKPRAEAYLVDPEYLSLVFQCYRKHFVLKKHAILISLCFYSFSKMRLIFL